MRTAKAQMRSQPESAFPGLAPALTQYRHMSSRILGLWKTVGREARLTGWGPMHRRKSTAQQWSNQSLLRRLAALEVAFAAGSEIPPKRTESSRKRRSAAFALGFTTAVLMGAIALVILSFVSLQSARADSRLPMAGLPREAATDALSTGVVAPSVDLWSGPRELWWRFPKADR
jgi:hypothetical protein